MRKKTKGFSLVEMLLVCGIFLMVIVLAGDLFVNGWIYTRRAIPRTDQLRTSRRVVNDITDNIMMSKEIYSVDPLVLAKSYRDTSANIITEIIGYIPEKQTNILSNMYQVNYRKPYIPSNPQIISSKLLGKNIRKCEITTDNSIYNIDLVIFSPSPEEDDITLKTKVMRKM
ncbi:MAG: prepilin-type N-terminal cleavage/methylation domain-containing protein [Armatimonadota bacterium]